jgi:hypothetical protein
MFTQLPTSPDNLSLLEIRSEMDYALSIEAARIQGERLARSKGRRTK